MYGSLPGLCNDTAICYYIVGKGKGSLWLEQKRTPQVILTLRNVLHVR